MKCIVLYPTTLSGTGGFKTYQSIEAVVYPNRECFNFNPLRILDVPTVNPSPTFTEPEFEDEEELFEDVLSPKKLVSWTICL